VTETPTNVTNVTETPGPGNASGTPGEISTETPTGQTPVAQNNTTTKQTTPGFDFMPALIGLLAVVYFVRKNR
jgi:hypothetical protein